MSSAASTPEVHAPASFKRKSDDVGWKYGYLVDPKNPNAVTCKRCKKEVNGGIYRLKQHVAGIGNTCGKCLDATKEEKDELGGKLLKEEVERTKELLQAHELERVLTGCSIMTDAWSDRKRRSIMNLCSHCSLGTSFLESKEASDEPHTAELIYEYVDGCIERMGVDNVVQVVTDNASNNMAAKEMMKDKRPRIFWTSCATHTINLMLQSIGANQKFSTTIDKAKAATIFIYSHHRTLALMRRFTKKRDIIRPGVTRFASAFLTLQSLYKKRNELRNMTWSEEWTQNKLTKVGKGKLAGTTLGSRAFWNGVSKCLKVFGPLVHLLRMVDSDRASMPWIYGELLRAKKEIKEAVYENKENEYKPIIDAMDKKMKNRLDAPLHLTAYLLNPYYSYADRDIFLNETIIDGFFTAVETFYYCEGDKQSQVINVDFEKFKKQEGFFGKFAARHGAKDMNFSPAAWWAIYGCHTPTLQRMAVRILGLTASASGCERNWSSFEGIHTKKRNRLDVNRLQNLVYVQFNARLLDRQEKSKEKGNGIDVLLANDAVHVQDWLAEDAYGPERPVNIHDDDIIDVEGLEETEATQPRRSVRVRELYEDDFKSDSEGEIDVIEEEIEYEDDDDDVGVEPLDDDVDV